MEDGKNTMGGNMKIKHQFPDGTPFTQEGLRSLGWRVDVVHERIDKDQAEYIKMIMELTGLHGSHRTPRDQLQEAVRPLRDFNAEELPPWPTGGRTRVILTSPEGKRYEQRAHCSVLDGYNKKLGYFICMGRLAK